jgi:hypothetical protein
MSRTLQVPNEPRIVQTFALTINQGDTSGRLMEPSALTASISASCTGAEAFIVTYDWAIDLKDWEQEHCTRRFFPLWVHWF